MTDPEAACPKCAAVVGRADRFCEACGTVLADIRQVGVPRHERATEGPCGDCGNTKPFGEYCDVCGHRRTLPDRDEAEIGPVFVITDRGVEHAANEDAAAAGMVAGGADRPALIAAVVCDGVSSSRESSAAAVAASTAGVDAMLMALNGSRPARAAMLEGLAVAAKAAAAARTDPTTAPSCTYTAVTVVPEAEGAVQITVGNVGDSRAYWFPAPPEPGQQLTVDDSVSQELITAGLPADSEAVQRGAHTITRWMGADAEPQPWADSSVHALTVNGPGVVLLCSDGLWNYLPEAADVGRFLEGTDPVTAARALVDHAIRAGGSDNITVIVIPIGGPA
jgi:serine/threonine protein phosphatase PrpC